MARLGFNALLLADDPAHAFIGARLPSALTPWGEELALDPVAPLATASETMSRRSYDVVVLGLPSGGASALAHVRGLIGIARAAPVVVSIMSFDTDFALEALKLGVEDVLSSAESSSERFARALRYAITRRRARGDLQAGLREKEVLLHELHHRAKNNLQVISGLLNMQARRERDPRFRELVATAQQRIDAIALAHEKLHQAPDLARIDFSAYLTALARAVHLSYGGEARGVALELAVDGCELPLQEAVPTGLVVNELLMNAFKHAFPEGRAGVVRLSASQTESLFTVEVADDGVGLPRGATQDPRRLGLEIVATLAEQLEASLEHGSDDGTRFRLSFTCSSKGLAR